MPRARGVYRLTWDAKGAPFRRSTTPTPSCQAAMRLLSYNIQYGYGRDGAYRLDVWQMW